MNVIIFRVVNNFANNSKILDFIGIFFAEHLLWIAVGILIILFLIKKTRFTAICAASSIILGRLMITEIIKRLYSSPRPYLVLDNVNKLINENHDYQSFPSGHAAIFFALATAIYFFHKKWGIGCFVIAILVAISRIFIGVHWPTDVLAGALIGVISSIIIFYGFKIKNKRDFGLAGKGDKF
jgi:undecaprenyl-diphosphatase